MVATLRAVPRSSRGAREWDAALDRSPDATLLHRTVWLDAAAPGRDASFFVEGASGEVLAQVVLRRDRLRLAGRLPIPILYNARAGIAYASSPSAELRCDIDRFVATELRRLGRRTLAPFAMWELPSFASDRGAAFLLRARALTATVPAPVIDLRQSEEELWKGLRKGCRSAIRKAERSGLEVRPASTEEEVFAFCSIHAETMTRVGAPAVSFEIWLKMWRALSGAGLCELLLARLPSGRPIAGVFVIGDAWMAYYYAAGTSLEHRSSGANSLLVHRALLRSRGRGLESFHLGPTPRRGAVSEREYLVGRFKHQFGGVEERWTTAQLPLVRGVHTALEAWKRVRRTLRQLHSTAGPDEQ